MDWVISCANEWEDYSSNLGGGVEISRNWATAHLLVFWQCLGTVVVPLVVGLPLWLSWWRIHLWCGRPGFEPWFGKIPWRSERLPTPVFWPREFHGLYSPWGHRESLSVVVVMLVVQLCPTFCATPSTVARQASLSMGFSRQEWRIPEQVAISSSGDLPDPGIKPRSPALQADSLPSELQSKSTCLPSWAHLILISLCCVLGQRHSFKSCALPLSLLWHIYTLFLFLRDHSSLRPQRLIMVAAAIWNWAGPCGALPSTNSFLIPHFLFVRNRPHSASLTFSEFQRADSNSC